MVNAVRKREIREHGIIEDDARAEPVRVEWARGRGTVRATVGVAVRGIYGGDVLADVKKQPRREGGKR